ILSQMQSGKTNFVLSTEEVIRLSKAGVPANVIEGMRDPKKIPAQPAAAVAKAPTPTPTVPQTKQPPPTPATQAKEIPPQPVPQPQAPPPTPVAAPTPAKPVTATVTIPDGQPFSITLTADIPNNAEEGMPLRFALTSDFKIGDQVAISRGTLVSGA